MKLTLASVKIRLIEREYERYTSYIFVSRSKKSAKPEHKFVALEGGVPLGPHRRPVTHVRWHIQKKLNE